MLKAKDDLRDGIHMLLAAGLEGTWPLGPQEPVLTREEYMLLYTRVHSFVKRHVNGEATATLESDRAGHDNGEVLYRVAESELHASCQHCRWQVQTAQDPVEAYEAVFGRYLFNVKVVNNVLAFPNRHWTPQHRETTRRVCFEALELAMVLWRDTVLRGSDGIMVRLARAVATASPAAEASLCSSFDAVLGTHDASGRSSGRVAGGSTVAGAQGALDSLPVYYNASRCSYWTRLVHRQCSRTVQDVALTLILVAHTHAHTHALLDGPDGPDGPQMPCMPVELFELIMSFVGRTPGRLVYTDTTRPR